MRHAFEADHVAAVATITIQEKSLPKALKLGVAWGIGHTIMLFLFGSIILFVTDIIPEKIVYWLEFSVGVMLVILGIDIIRRVIVDRVHFHSHSHETGETHFHAHSHKGEKSAHHEDKSHEHQHKMTSSTSRALLIGMVHGMAGSAALIILALQTVSSPWIGILYIILFGVGSIIGMALFSFVLVIPLRATRHLTGLFNSLQVAVGMLTLSIGLFTMSTNIMNVL
jgi:ABC-type nickel/cobalt efflux system permease component RcnA